MDASGESRPGGAVSTRHPPPAATGIGAMTQDRATPGRTSATRVLDLLASRLPRRRLRLLQWLIASLAYVGAAVLLVVGVQQG